MISLHYIFFCSCNSQVKFSLFSPVTSPDVVESAETSVPLALASLVMGLQPNFSWHINWSCKTQERLQLVLWNLRGYAVFAVIKTHHSLQSCGMKPETSIYIYTPVCARKIIIRNSKFICNLCSDTSIIYFKFQTRKNSLLNKLIALHHFLPKSAVECVRFLCCCLSVCPAQKPTLEPHLNTVHCILLLWRGNVQRSGAMACENSLLMRSVEYLEKKRGCLLCLGMGWSVGSGAVCKATWITWCTDVPASCSPLCFSMCVFLEDERSSVAAVCHSDHPCYPVCGGVCKAHNRLHGALPEWPNSPS